MIIEMNSEDFASLVLGHAPRNLLLADTPVATADVLKMLADLAETVGATFSPASWLVVEKDEVVGLVSVTRPPEYGTVDIGYGIAPSRQGRGHASAAVRELVRWAREAPYVLALTAETARSNHASQRTLQKAGFVAIGERLDDEDGPLIQWRFEAS